MTLAWLMVLDCGVLAVAIVAALWEISRELERG